MEKSEYISRRRSDFRLAFSSPLSNSYFNIFVVALIFLCSLIYSSANIRWSVGTFPIIFFALIYSEAVFYFAHRFQQHRKGKFGGWAFEMHTLWHHSMFSNEKMDVDSCANMNMVVLPFSIYAFVIGIIYFPLGHLLENFFVTDIGWILMLAVTLHFVWYEIVHALSHMENPPILKQLAMHHREHHDPRLMGKYNFGIGSRLFDRVFGTLYKGH